MPFPSARLPVLMCLLMAAGGQIASAAKPPRAISQSFGVDPLWEGFRNRLPHDEPHAVVQDFGHRRSNQAGGQSAGEIGGRVQRSAEPAYYAMKIAPKTLDDRLHASGTLAVPAAGGGSGVMIGWFQAPPLSWRTPNSLAFRVDGNGGKFWVFYEYGTGRWRTGGGGAFAGEQYQRTTTLPFPADGKPHRWSLDYDPAGAGGLGEMTFQIDNRQYRSPIIQGHREDGTRFDHFGIWNVQTPGDHLELYLDDLEVDGQKFRFDEDPAWDASGNQAQYVERFVRPYHDFGFSNTAHAGGQRGEIGGIVFRDERPSYYGTPTGKLTLDDELRASGRLSLNKAASDSGVYIGWFNASGKQAKRTPAYEEPQADYLGALVEGPSRAGHFFRPAYGCSDTRGQIPGEDSSTGNRWPIVYPDGTAHEFAIHYRPQAAGGQGQIEITFDGHKDVLDLRPGDREAGAALDRFGIFNLQSGGHAVEIYLDDLEFTAGKD